MLDNDSVISYAPEQINKTFDENQIVSPKNNYHNAPRNEKQKNSLQQTFVDNDHNKKSEQMLNDQLIAVRINKHNDYLSFKNSNDNKTIDKKVTFDDKNIEITKNTKSKGRKNVIICGDSMVNSLDSNGISSKFNNVAIRSFSGATSKDMLDYCKPLVNNKPDVLIFHVGTNDLTKNVGNTKANIVKLIDSVKNASPNTEIVFSNICLREDVPNINPRRLALNKDLEDVCNEYGLPLIDNKI